MSAQDLFDCLLDRYAYACLNWMSIGRYEVRRYVGPQLRKIKKTSDEGWNANGTLCQRGVAYIYLDSMYYPTSENYLLNFYQTNTIIHRIILLCFSHYGILSRVINMCNSK